MISRLIARREATTITLWDLKTTECWFSRLMATNWGEHWWLKGLQSRWQSLTSDFVSLVCASMPTLQSTSWTTSSRWAWLGIREVTGFNCTLIRRTMVSSESGSERICLLPLLRNGVMLQITKKWSSSGRTTMSWPVTCWSLARSTKIIYCTTATRTNSCCCTVNAKWQALLSRWQFPQCQRVYLSAVKSR